MSNSCSHICILFLEIVKKKCRGSMSEWTFCMLNDGDIHLCAQLYLHTYEYRRQVYSTYIYINTYVCIVYMSRVQTKIHFKQLTEWHYKVHYTRLYTNICMNLYTYLCKLIFFLRGSVVTYICYFFFLSTQIHIQQAKYIYM